MKLPVDLISLSLATLAGAHVVLGQEETTKGPDTIAPTGSNRPISTKVETPPKPPTRSAVKLPPSISSCRYSCPLRDDAGLPLVMKSGAFGWDFDGYFAKGAPGRAGKWKGDTKGKGWYDVFECVYNLPTFEAKEHTCTYYKHDGTHALGHPGNDCPPQAPACPDPSSTPPVVPILGLTAEDLEDDESMAESSTPHFSSSQVEGAQLLDPAKGTYKYTDTLETPPWVLPGRHLLYLKEHPPEKL